MNAGKRIAWSRIGIILALATFGWMVLWAFAVLLTRVPPGA